MNWLVRFLKLRKQNDSVKILLLFGIAGIGFLISFFRGALDLYKGIHQPVEYVLTSASSRPLTGYVDEIMKMDHVECVSFQQEAAVKLTMQNKESVFNCLILSEEYLEKAYGIRENSSMRVFFMNSLVLEQMRMDMELSEKESLNMEEWRPDYELAKQESETGTAKLILIENGIPNEQPLVFGVGSNLELSNIPIALRVRVGKNDLDGSQINQFLRMGLTIANEDEMKMASAERETQFVCLKYELIIAGLCFLFVVCLMKYGKRPVLK